MALMLLGEIFSLIWEIKHFVMLFNMAAMYDDAMTVLERSLC